MLFFAYETSRSRAVNAVNEGMASFMEYKCVEAVFPEMSAAALSQLASSPMGTLKTLNLKP